MQAATMGEEFDDAASDTTLSASQLSTMSLGLSRPRTVQDELAVVARGSDSPARSPTKRRPRGTDDSSSAAAETTEQFAVAAQLGQLTQQLAELQGMMVERQLALAPPPPRRELPALQLGEPPPPERTALDELETWFEEVDTDGSGDIDMEEMREALVARLGSWVDRTAVEDLLARADTDGNGSVDWAEIVAMAEKEGWAAVAKQEEKPLPTATLLCSEDREWAFQITAGRAVIGRTYNARVTDEDSGEPQPSDPSGAGEDGVACKLPTENRKVSRAHCEVKLAADGERWTVQSIKGNPLLLNGIRVRGVSPLQSYDRIGVGPVVVVFMAEGRDEAAVAAAQAAASTAVVLRGEEPDDPAPSLSQSCGENEVFASFLTDALAKVEARIGDKLKQFEPEPEPQPEKIAFVEPEPEPEPEESGGGGNAADTEALVRQLERSLHNYSTFFGPDDWRQFQSGGPAPDWRREELQTVASICQQLGKMYEKMVRQSTRIHRQLDYQVLSSTFAVHLPRRTRRKPRIRTGIRPSGSREEGRNEGNPCTPLCCSAARRAPTAT